MSKRIYNILFHTHTVSGIIISVGLYIIFFAGSFSFFRDEIIAWERNEPIEIGNFPEMDFNKMVNALDKEYNVYSRDISFTKYFEERRVGVDMSAPKNTMANESGVGRKFFYMDVKTLETYSYASNYSLGEFLYRLHFFAQLNLYGTSGYLLAGTIAFFFLFAIITGVLVHWKKIIPKFYVFRPREKLKTLWTDAHTTLGILGLPYQFVYALTGVFLIVGTVIMSPPVLSVVYDGNTEKMYEDFGLGTATFPLGDEKIASEVDINSFIDRTKSHWQEFRIKTVALHNYGNSNMHVSITGHPVYSEALIGKGKLVFKAETGKIVSEKDPFQHVPYVDGATGIMDRLHFGDFGGMGLKIVYFILGIISCFVIISGVMIWLVARDKKHIAPKKRKFNTWMGRVYLAVCLSMYPTTAFTFLAVKLFVFDFDAGRMTSIYQIFFYSWFVFTVLLTMKKSLYFTNKACLISGSVLGILVPVANGIISGNWFWKTFSEGHFAIFFVDVFWIVLSITTFIAALLLKRKPGKIPKKSIKSNKKALEVKI